MTPKEKIELLIKSEENEIRARKNLFSGVDPAVELARIRIIAFRQALECFVEPPE